MRTADTLQRELAYVVLRLRELAYCIRGALGDDDEGADVWAGELEEIAARLERQQ